jgi:hypothetical protein
MDTGSYDIKNKKDKFYLKIFTNVSHDIIYYIRIKKIQMIFKSGYINQKIGLGYVSMQGKISYSMSLDG